MFDRLRDLWMKINKRYIIFFDPLLEKELEVLKTKDKYGRDVVDPNGGIRVGLDDFGDSAVNIAIKQSVLVTEKFGYTARLKVLLYKLFNENNITIPFPQRDIHIINEKD